MIGVDTIYQGDARELIAQVDDESIDLVYTDPVYDRIEDYDWLSREANRILKPGGVCLVYAGIGYLHEVIPALNNLLDYHWQYINYKPTHNARGAYMTFSNYRSLLCYFPTSGKAKPQRHIRDLITDNFHSENSCFKWVKNMFSLAYYLTAWSEPGALVLDPFAGSGSIPVTCKRHNRHYIGFELEAERANLAIDRLAKVQPVVQETFKDMIMQAEMELDYADSET